MPPSLCSSSFLFCRLISIGDEFTGSKSELLQEAMHKQTQNYFHRYHSGCMEEVKMFLENEGWELCPVRSSFTILQLQVVSPSLSDCIRADLSAGTRRRLCWESHCQLHEFPVFFLVSKHPSSIVGLIFFCFWLRNWGTWHRC